MKQYLLLLFIVGLYSASSAEQLEDEENEEVVLHNTTCSCGWTNRVRVVGGQETRRHEYPLMVAVEDRRTQICGGAILTKWHVLTAAHCTRRRKPSDLTIRVGGHERYGKGEGRYRISKIRVHWAYRRRTQANDIAILVISKPIRFSANVGPACLMTQRANLTGQPVTALGWGLTKQEGQYSSVLQKVDLRVISFRKCKVAWSKGNKYTPKSRYHICTYGMQKDTCTGDSGGPILWVDPELHRYSVVGIVSFGSTCGGSVPGVNTDVSAYSSWIERTITKSKLNVTACTKI